MTELSLDHLHTGHERIEGWPVEVNFVHQEFVLVSMDMMLE